MPDPAELVSDQEILEAGLDLHRPALGHGERQARNKAYARYMRMHKVLVGGAGAEQLKEIYEQLKDEIEPHRLSVAGWAAIESALVATNQPQEERLELFHRGVFTWTRAFKRQYGIEHLRGSYDRHKSHRIALDIASLPLLEGMICGNVTEADCRRSFDASLMVAQSNLAAMKRAQDAGKEAGPHIGLGFEVNALLAFNRTLSSTWFAIPAMARCDSGVFYERQTHDLVAIHQRRGRILSASPVEVKARNRPKDNVHYHALVVRGRLHLSVPEQGHPDYMLKAIAAVHEGTATEEQAAGADAVTERVTSMLRDYYAGRVIGRAASKHTVTVFHDNARVLERHSRQVIERALREQERALRLGALAAA